MNKEQARQITHELREYGYDSAACDEGLEHQTALDAADLIESLQRERDNPQPLTIERMREIVLSREDNAIWVQPTHWFNNGFAYRALLDLFQNHIVALDTRSMTNGIDDETFDEYNYGETWLAYAAEPKGDEAK